MDPLIFIVIISVLGPIIGSFLGILKYATDRFVYNMLAFAAGIMITISFLELIPEALELSAPFVVVAGIFTGAMFMFILDKFIPHFHPSSAHDINESCDCTGKDAKKLRRMSRTAKYLIAGIFFHNFPEGMAIAAMQDPKLGITVALAIAIHNIPEGICTSAPYYHATGNRLKAFLLSSSTAIPVLLGFLVAHFLVQAVPDVFTGFIAAATAGLMIYISVDELIPSSCKKLSKYSTALSFMVGSVFIIILEALI